MVRKTNEKNWKHAYKFEKANFTVNGNESLCRTNRNTATEAQTIVIKQIYNGG